MPEKMARSDPRPSFGLPELLVAIHTSRQSCSKAGKARIFALVWESSGESRNHGTVAPRGKDASFFADTLFPCHHSHWQHRCNRTAGEPTCSI
jgi:hypothetical protein